MAGDQMFSSSASPFWWRHLLPYNHRDRKGLSTDWRKVDTTLTIIEKHGRAMRWDTWSRQEDLRPSNTTRQSFPGILNRSAAHAAHSGHPTFNRCVIVPIGMGRFHDPFGMCREKVSDDCSDPAT